MWYFFKRTHLTFCSPLLDAAGNQSQRIGLHRRAQDGVQLLLLWVYPVLNERMTKLGEQIYHFEKIR